MDHFSPVAPAHIRVLVLPIGRIERERFANILRRLQLEASIVSLKELQLEQHEDGFLLSPSNYPLGSLFLNFSASSTTEQQQQLSPFELFREPLLVLGVIDGLSDDNIVRTDELRHAAEILREKHARVVHRHLIALEHKDNVPDQALQYATTVNLSSDSGNLSLEHAIQRISICFLRDLTTYSKAMQASPGIQTPGHFSQSLLRLVTPRDDDNKPKSGVSTPQDVGSPTRDDGSPRPPSRNVIPPATSFDHIPAVNALTRSDSHGSGKSRGRVRASSFDRIAVHTLSKEKLKDRGKARVGMVLGSIHLMAGQWSEALRILTEHTTRLRALGDHIWHAKGLENIFVCLALQAWAGVDFQVPPICYQLSDKVRDRFSMALPNEVQLKAFTNMTPMQRLSSSIPELLRHILELYRSIEGSLELLYLPRSEATVRFSKLLAILHRSGGHLDDTALTQIVQGGTLSSPSKIPTDHKRLRASPIHVSTGPSKTSIADLLSDALPTASDSLTVPETLVVLGGVAAVYAMLQMHRKEAITLKALIIRLTQLLNQARKVGAAEMGIHPTASLSIENGPDALLETIQESVGLDSMVSELAEIYGVHILNHVTGNSEAPSSAHLSNERNIAIARSRTLGDDQLKIETLQELLAFCEAAPYLHGIFGLVTSTMVCAGPFGAVDTQPNDSLMLLSTQEQTRLVTALGRTAGLSRQLGLSETQGKYWDPFLVRHIGFVVAQPDLALLDRSKTASSSAQKSANPLLYDPNAPRATLAVQDNLLVLDESAECCVTLQNPYDVNLEIESLEIVTDGVELKSFHQDVQIGPSRMQQLTFSVRPTAVGKSIIQGCRIKVVGCLEQTFYLVEKPWVAPKPPVTKAFGQLMRYEDEEVNRKLTGPEYAKVPVEVLPPQPSVVVQDISLVQQSVMLLEGERRLFSAKLRNLSNVPAIILDFTFSDPNLKRSHDDRDSSETLLIDAGGISELYFELTGKPGLTEAHVDILYSDGEHGRYARRCRVSVGVTVHELLRVHDLEVSATEKEEMQVSLDVQNVWPEAIHFTCMVLEGAHQWQQVLDGPLPYDEVRRLSFRLPRWIECVSDYTDDRVRAEMFDRVRLTWSLGDRQGDVDLRSPPLSPSSLAVIRGPAIAIDLTVHDNGDATSIAAKATARLGSFVIIRATITNRTSANHPLLLKLHPHVQGLPVIDARRVTLAGCLHRLLAPLPAAGKTTVDLAVCPLLSGSLHIGASVRSALPSSSATDPYQGLTDSSVLLRVVD